MGVNHCVYIIANSRKRMLGLIYKQPEKRVIKHKKIHFRLLLIFYLKCLINPVRKCYNENNNEHA